MSIDRLVAHWRNAGVGLRPRASTASIRAIEELLGATLPDEARAFYEAADGMRDSESDSTYLSVWSSERLLAERCVCHGEDERGELIDVAFADVMISSWFFYYRIRPGQGVSVFAEATFEELPTFMTFVVALLERPESLGLVRVK